jgi:hypothetical protein
LHPLEHSKARLLQLLVEATKRILESNGSPLRRWDEEREKIEAYREAGQARQQRRVFGAQIRISTIDHTVV